MSFPGHTSAKQRPTFFTPERVAVARANVERYQWGRDLRDRILQTGDSISYYTGSGKYTAADTFAVQSDEFMWQLQPPTRIPRLYRPANHRHGCPIHGTAIQKHRVWNPWRIEPIQHPYQVQCPEGKEWLPTNKYHEGDMTSGDYPDDGSGVLRDGKRYYLLQEYAHMVYGSVVTPTLRSLSEAYQLTGDPIYARKGCILLARLATEYPNYGWEADLDLGLPARPDLEDRFERTYIGPWNNSHPYYGGKQGGMITDCIWETFNLEAIAYAYDGLFEYMDKDPGMLEFLEQKGMPVNTADGLRQYIETYILRAGMRALLKVMIRGNEGHHQSTAMAIALVLDDYSGTRPNSKDMVDYSYHGLGHCAYLLTNGISRDGGGHESPGYNTIKFDFIRVARALDDIRRQHPGVFPEDTYPDIFAGPKARRMFDYYIDIVVHDSDYPAIGDAGGVGAIRRVQQPTYSFLTSEYLYALQRFGDPRHARAATAPDGTRHPGDLWEAYPDAEIDRALALPESQIARVSRLLDGYGVAILESGEFGQRRSAVLNYSSLRGHWQPDHLTLWLYARGVNLLPDLGYPKTWQYRRQWDSNSLAHNTVTVDESEPARAIGGMGRLFVSAGGVHVVTASHDPYPDGTQPAGGNEAAPVDLYERTLILVEIDDDRFYVVDLFAVSGGIQHDQSWHGLPVPIQAPDLDWRAQEGGTLAGPDVPQYGEWTDRWGRQRNDFPGYLVDIRRSTLKAPAAWTWNSGLPEGDSLRLHVIPVGGPVKLAMGRGRSPARTQDMEYLLVRRKADLGTPSHFLSVLDGYQKEPVVIAVRLLSEAPIKVEVKRPDGVDEITIHTPEGPSRMTRHRPVGVGVSIGGADGQAREVRIGSLGDGRGPGYTNTTVGAVRYAQQEIAVPYVPDHEATFTKGRTLRVYNRERSALFRIEDARRKDDQLWLSLDHSALVARGPVKETRDGTVVLDAHLTFATGVVKEERLQGIRHEFAGTWMSEVDTARQVKAATTSGTVYLADAIPAETLRSDCGGRVVSIWQYGVGDRVEMARVRCVPPAPTPNGAVQ